MIKQKLDKHKYKIPLLPKFFPWYLDRLWISRIIAIISACNLGLVVFDLTYVPLRDIWLNGKITIGKFKIGPYQSPGMPLRILPKSWSKIITQYDVIKGIEPHRDTQNFSNLVQELEISIKQNGLEGEETEKILSALRKSSEEMIAQDPFRIAKRSGTLEVIKNRMRDHMSRFIDNPEDSSRVAMTNFFTVEHLRNRVDGELKFFHREITPLIRTNFFRPIGENGNFVDYFGLIDFPFIVIIFVDFIIRCFGISIRYHGVNFKDAVLWRWYDLIFLLPQYRWLRIIPVTIRWDEAKLLDSKRLKKQASQGFVAGIAGDITEIVILRVVNQVQGIIKDGQLEKALISQEKQREYIDLNDINEVAKISKLVIDLVVKEVLPEIRPEVENLLIYLISRSILQSPMYQNISHLPNLNKLPDSLSQSLGVQLYQIFLDTVNNLTKDDPIFDQHWEKIITKFGQTIVLRPNAKYDVNKIEELLVALLEEVKVNYIQNLSHRDVEALLDETRALRE